MTLKTGCFHLTTNVMITSTKQALAGLAMLALLGSCSRPVAYFQPSKAERFYTQTTTTPPTFSQEVTAPMAPVGLEEATASTLEQAPTVATRADIEQLLVRTQAVASAKAQPAEARKLERRISKIREVLATTPDAKLTQPAATQKMGLAQRLMMKQMDKKIQKKLAPAQPEQPMRSSTLTAGLVIGLIGLLLLLLTTGTAATIGLIALVVGIVLVILGLL
jgi:hypothetical protein